MEFDVTKRQKKASIGGRIAFKLLNDHQVRAWDAMKSHDITFLVGPAGSAKSHLATAFAAEHVVKGFFDKVFVTRPVVEAAGERLGFLPGSYEDKISPYLRPIYDCLDSIFPEDSKILKEFFLERVEMLPLALARGRTMSNAVCILDEAQNATESQMRLWMTRMGIGSKLIITGDQTQADIHDPCLNRILDAMSDVDEVAIVDMPASAIVRHPVVGKILDAFDRMRT
jgi:phosphate starvation-inducible protein PhoH and related proteins